MTPAHHCRSTGGWTQHARHTYNLGPAPGGSQDTRDEQAGPLPGPGLKVFSDLQSKGGPWSLGTHSPTFQPHHVPLSVAPPQRTWVQAAALGWHHALPQERGRAGCTLGLWKQAPQDREYPELLPDNPSPEEGEDDVEQQRPPDDKVVYPRPVVRVERQLKHRHGR